MWMRLSIWHLPQRPPGSWVLSFDVLQEEKENALMKITLLYETEQTSKDASTSAAIYAPPCPLWILQIPGIAREIVWRDVFFRQPSELTSKQFSTTWIIYDNMVLFDVFCRLLVISRINWSWALVISLPPPVKRRSDAVYPRGPRFSRQIREWWTPT